MSPLDLIVWIGAWALTLPYVCRLDRLRLGTHRTPMILLHLVLFVGCMSAGVDAWAGSADLSDVCAVGAAALWIAVSYPTWRAGVPEYQERPPSMPSGALARMVADRSHSSKDGA